MFISIMFLNENVNLCFILLNQSIYSNVHTWIFAIDIEMDLKFVTKKVMFVTACISI